MGISFGCMAPGMGGGEMKIKEEEKRIRKIKKNRDGLGGQYENFIYFSVAWGPFKEDEYLL